MKREALPRLPATLYSTATLERVGGPGLLLILVWPLLLTALYPGWLFLNSWTFTDTWIYFGHFLNLPNLLQIYGDQPQLYFDDRMAWIGPGYVLYHLLPPLAANAVLRFGVYYGTVLSIYGVLALTVGRRAATAGALLCGSYSYFLLAAGSDYVEGASTAYFALALLLITLAALRPRRRLWLALAGAAAATPVFNNIFALALAPCLLLAYGWLNRRRPAREHFEALAFAGIGAAALAVALGLFSVAIGGKFLFILSSLRFALTLARAERNTYIAPPENWELAHTHLVWPMVALVAALVALAIPRQRRALRDYPLAPLLLALHVLAGLTMIAVQLRQSTPVLVVYYYAGHLTPTTFLAIGALLAPALGGLRRRQAAAILGGLGAVALAGVVFHRCGGLQLGAFPNTLPALLGAAWVGAMLIWPRRPWSALPLLVAFYVATPNPFLGNFGPNSFCALYRQPDLSQEYLAVIDGNRAVAESAPGTRVYFWYNLAENNHYRSLAATYLHSYNLINEAFPALPPPGPGAATPLSPNVTVALLTRDTAGVQTAQRALLEHQREMKILGQRSVQHGDFSYVVTVFHSEPLPVPVEVERSFDLASPVDAGQILRDGWDAPEPFGSWTFGPRAEIVADLQAPAGWDVALSLDVVTSVGAFVPENQRPTVTVRVLANDVPVGSWTFDRTNTGGPRQVVIPAAVLARERPLRVTLEVDRPHSLQELGYNDDARPLAIAVSRLAFLLAP
jgi:hypothetical protein